MIPIRNLYYMLSYAFRALETDRFQNVEAETFENIPDLFAQIIIQGVELLLKQGLVCRYQPVEESLGQIRGKIDMTASIRDRSIQRHQMVCRYEQFTPDQMINRIIKCTMELLVRSEISSERKKKLRRQLDYFRTVRSIPPTDIDWHIRFDSRTETSRMLIGICYLTIKGLLMTQENGNMKLRHFLDDQAMHHLYERFILAFYQREFPRIKADARQIPWMAEGNTNYLPVMRSDIFLENAASVLIIDAKYYSHTMQTRFDKQTVHSNNLYQIFTYVMNEKIHSAPKHVAGMLLYARTDEDTQPDETYKLCGNTFSVRTLDLNQPFEQIKSDLNHIVAEFMI